MNWVPILLLLSIGCLGKEIDNTNDINEPPASLNLDTNLRKALLKALADLEKEEKEKIEDENVKTIFLSTTPSTDDKIVEKASATAVSIITKQEIPRESEEVTTTTTQKPIVVVQKSNGLQAKPIISVHSNIPDPTDEQFIASATSSFRDNFSKTETRSVGGNIKLNSVTINDKTITSGVKSVSITPKTEVTTAFPTTTTPENEAKVEDVQFFSAPLVAAFTVHQDERGLPKKVEPIYKPGQSKNLDHNTKINSEEFIRQEQLKQEQFRSQISFQEKQKALEEEVLKLQREQQKQQDYLLKQQRLLLEQQAQNDRLRELAEKQRQKQNEQPFIPIIPSVNQPSTFNQQTTSTKQFNNLNSNSFQNNFSNQNLPLANQLSNNHFNNIQPTQFPSLTTSAPPTHFNNIDNFHHPPQFNPPPSTHFGNTFNQFKNNKENTIVSLQPSLSVSPSDLAAGVLPLNAQILPIRNAIDFHQSPPTIFSSKFNSLIQPPTTAFGAFQTFQNNQNNFVQNLPSPHSNRVFRQETNVANQGFNQFQQPQHHNRFFRSNLESFQNQPNFFPHNPNLNHQHLNNLLFHSGITRNVRQNEDLNIVSKILSYNLGRDNLFAGSRTTEQRIPTH